MAKRDDIQERLIDFNENFKYLWLAFSLQPKQPE